MSTSSATRDPASHSPGHYERMDRKRSNSGEGEYAGVVGVPDAEVEVNEQLVRQLLVAQCPELSGHSLRQVNGGWDNSIFRLGSDLAVRLPRRAFSAPLIDRELNWVPSVVKLCSLAVPEPVFRGGPDSRFPWNWSIVTWVAGQPAGPYSLADSWSAAGELGGFVRGLHVPAPLAAPTNPLRGVELAQRSDAVSQFAERVARLVETGPLLAMWQEAVAADVFVGAPVWVHGDLHPLNVMTRDRQISGVIDFGDLAAGDPAVDLAAAWLMFDEPVRARFLTESGGDRAAVRRAKGWAILFGLAFLAHSADSPVNLDVGMTTLNRLR